MAKKTRQINEPKDFFIDFHKFKRSYDASDSTNMRSELMHGSEL